ncbi:SdpI family protein [Corynebacterium sp. A21]|uniref:SdpI family protein n=1 Tax=Corynebacterium sp. A21 TaxID=3457318 RepID=UPI003FD0C97D
MESDLAGMVMLLFSVVLVAVVCIAVTRMAADGRMKRHGSAGIRTRHTQRSDAAWQAGHAAALPMVYRIGWLAAVTIVGAVSTHFFLGGNWGVFVGLGGMLAEIIVLLAASGAANKAAQAAP